MKRYSLVLFVLSISILALFQACSSPKDKSKPDSITPEMVAAAEQLFGLEFDAEERALMLGELGKQLKAYQSLRENPIDNAIPPAQIFNPLPVGFKVPNDQEPIDWGLSRLVEMPANREELAFYSVADLSQLIQSKHVTSVELTELYLRRLKRFGDTLECVVSLTEDLALEQARRADREIAEGQYKGPLHGIPFGVKDLLSVPGYPTTWGAKPYREQVLDEQATVVLKLEEAGAVLVAKLTMGALAWGDVWFGGKTKNPWDLKQGSSGSSAGPSSATAAGLVAFSIGTETHGSIVSPSTRCGNTGLRPTYGRVSRHGAMALSWSMDKIGPICRNAIDCALVFNVIRGSDGIDQTLIDASFNYQSSTELSRLRIGYLKSAFDQEYDNHEQDDAALRTLESLGVTLIPVELPDHLPVRSLSFILEAEAAAAFDDLTRSDKDDLLVRQVENAWPNVFRAARFIPAVEYIQANRLRYQLIQEMDTLMKTVDVLVSPSFGGNQLLTTNLTGHPCVVMPNGFDDKGHPTSISLIGSLFDEATILAVANAYQNATVFEEQHPDWLN
ncbi:MAG: Asp-tRNA(Asn)/Glu-tRNA(Gln) amidotransferase A subunit family amidase [Candidatus Pelagisphaera sp.]|jgi:Asp-tRNA(Asn)/Glu-tRNA(Gln) amidotransferase A subunit family amidase